MTCLQIRGFAGLELIGNGHSIQAFPTHHVKELLGYLLLNQNIVCSRDNLIELLWPYDVSENSRGCLNTVLWRLRGLFRQMGYSAQSFLYSNRDQIVFAPTEPLQFDVDCFENSLNAAWAAREDTSKLAELTEAIDLYRGDLYTGIYSDWCLIERERLARKYLQALGELMYCHIRLKDFAHAIAVGQTIIEVDPLREEIHQALIFCYGRLGQRAEAVAQFQQCADYLMNEVQALPMPDTVILYQQMMTACVKNNLNTPNPKLIKHATRAHAKFMKAGDRLNQLLDEIESLKSVPAP